jgi:hypothetical protein
MNDYIYVWCDGTWCEEADLEEYMDFMSDDYIKISVLDGESAEETADRYARSIGAY